uniref:FLYWCH-type domain-containing protein n=1 Tax=Strongyloides venezuelensis TaxID=75913 RepID=A0A0K0FEY5_STRVS
MNNFSHIDQIPENSQLLKQNNRERNIFISLFYTKTFDEARTSLTKDGFRERSQRGWHIYYTCKKRGCKKMARIKILQNKYLVSWNGKEHSCNVINLSKRGIPDFIKHFIKQKVFDKVKPREIKKMVEENFPSYNIEIKQIRNFCCYIRKNH